VTICEAALSTTTAALPVPGREGKDRALVQAMFDRVAPRYDLANTLLSMGQDAHWRRVAALAAQPVGARVLDVAAGPGNVAQELVARGAKDVVAADLSYNMLAEGHRRGLPDIHFVNADALALPFADNSFDAVTISFGLRNLVDPAAGLAEFHRVARSGARMVVMEFAAPTWAPLRKVYSEYLMQALPRIAEVVSSDGSSYGYLAESIAAWPDRRVVADWMASSGWQHVKVKDLSGGIVAIHRGFKA
jgi:demethylmenaquinone methyltransferase/2-methoxy-6-polyprenyl-1,4-benzoquinol methylase